jgi:hypothetical protein
LNSIHYTINLLTNVDDKLSVGMAKMLSAKKRFFSTAFLWRIDSCGACVVCENKNSRTRNTTLLVVISGVKAGDGAF